MSDHPDTPKLTFIFNDDVFLVQHLSTGKADTLDEVEDPVEVRRVC